MDVDMEGWQDAVSEASARFDEQPGCSERERVDSNQNAISPGSDMSLDGLSEALSAQDRDCESIGSALDDIPTDSDCEQCHDVTDLDTAMPHGEDLDSAGTSEFS